MNFTKRTGFALVGAIVLLGGCYFGSKESLVATSPEAGTRHEMAASLLALPRPLVPFKLSDHTGRAFSIESMKGKWTFLLFGYTNCPDTCPVGLTILSEVNKQLKAVAVDKPYQMVFVSVDPERDTEQRLANYVSYYNKDFFGVRGEAGELAKLASQLGILYVKVDTQDSAMGYTMDHSKSIILIDPDGCFYAVFGAPHYPDDIVEDFRKIIL